MIQRVPRKITLTMILAALVLVTGAVVFARSAAHGFRRGEGFRAHIAAELGITQEQQQKIDAIKDEDRDTLRAAHEKLAEKRQALQDALMADNVDQAAVEARTRELNDAQTAMLNATTAHRLKMQQVLTTEQRAKAREMLTKARTWRDEHRKARWER